MPTNPTLTELRFDFDRKRHIALPIAGAICWAVAGAFGTVLPFASAAIAMFICVGMIFPLSLLVGRVLHENVMSRDNELEGKGTAPNRAMEQLVRKRGGHRDSRCSGVGCPPHEPQLIAGPLGGAILVNERGLMDCGGECASRPESR
jgi:hypothetical protein